MGVGGQHHTLVALPPGKTQYPLYRRLGGPQAQSKWVRKILPQLGYDPQTVQPIASRYTARAIAVHYIYKHTHTRVCVCIYIYIYIYIYTHTESVAKYNIV